MNIKNMAVLACFILLSCGAGIIGSIFTFSSIPTWYATLNKPQFSPPNWVFGPVWTTLYVMMGVSAYFVYNNQKERKPSAILSIFYIQLILNAAWSIMFFGFRSPIYGLITIIALWISIVFTIGKFYTVSKKAALLLVPYMAWVTFASVLNYFIWILN